MDDHRWRPPVAGDEYDFRARVERDPRLQSIATQIEHELHEGRITIDDAVRCAVLGAQRYLERRNVPIVIRIEDTRHAPECAKCGRGRDAPAHDPAYAGGDHAFQGPT